MTYLPPYFSQTDQDKIAKLVEENPFAILLSFPRQSDPYINHLPVIFDPESIEKKFLIGHMAKRNPQWTHFKENPQATLIIQGGHTYITPTWYKSGRDVPTWNYAVAHIKGKIELLESFEEQIQILKKLTNFFESSSVTPWEFELPDDLLEPSALTSAIVSFKFQIESVEAKFKLSQNRSAEDQAGIIEGLATRADDQSRKVREMMLK